MQQPRLADAIRQLTLQLLHGAGPLAFSICRQIAEDPDVKAETRLKAAQDLLDRATGKAAQHLNVAVDVTHSLPEKELLDRIAYLQKEIGPEGMKHFIEAQYEEIIEPEEEEYMQIEAPHGS